MNTGTSHYPLALKALPAGIKLISNGLPDGNDVLVPGGMYALVAETPPARFPLLACALGSAAQERIPCSVMLPSQPKVFLDRVCSAGFPELGQEIETGHLQVFQLQQDFSKKMFRFGPEAFTRELDHFQIPADSLLVFDQADDLLSLHDANLAIDQLQKLGAWSRARNVAVLMVFTRGAATASMQASLSSLMDYLSGLARIGILNDGLTIAFDYWQGPLGTVAARSLALEVSESGLYRVREPGAVPDESAVTTGYGTDLASAPDDPVQRFFTLDEQVMKLADIVGGEWKLCTSVLGMIHAAIPFLSPIVFLTFSKDTDLRQLAEAVHTLRLSLSRRARIVVLEITASLRYSNEMLLLRLGTNLIMHRDVPSVRLPLLLETLKGQVFSKDVDINFEAALGSVITPKFRGYVPAATFVRETIAMLGRADMLGIPNTLLVGRPAQERSAQDLIDAVHLSRMGDLLTADDADCFLFLSSCPKASQNAAFDSIFKASLGVFFDACDIFSDPVQIRQRIVTLQAHIEKSPPIELRPARATPSSPPPEPAAQNVTPIPPLPEDMPQATDSPRSEDALPTQASALPIPAAVPEAQPPVDELGTQDRKSDKVRTPPQDQQAIHLLAQPPALTTPGKSTAIHHPPAPTPPGPAPNTQRPANLDIDLGALEAPSPATVVDTAPVPDFTPTRHECPEEVRPTPIATRFMRRESFPADSVFGDIEVLDATARSPTPQRLRFSPSAPDAGLAARPPQWSRLRNPPVSTHAAVKTSSPSQVGSFAAFKQQRAESLANSQLGGNNTSPIAQNRGEIEEVPWRGVNPPVAAKYRPRPVEPSTQAQDDGRKADTSPEFGGRTLKQRVFGSWFKP